MAATELLRIGVFPLTETTAIIINVNSDTEHEDLLFDIRKWRKNALSEWVPTTKGVSIPYNELPKILGALKTAMTITYTPMSEEDANS